MLFVKATTLVLVAPVVARDGARASSGCGGTAPASPGTTTSMSGTFDGIERTWRVYVPSGYTGTDAVPLIISTHGWGGSGKQDESGSGLTTTNGGYIAVFPDGLADNSNYGSWGSWNCVGSTLSPGPDGQTCTSSADPSNAYCYESCNGCPGADGCDWTTCHNDITSSGIGKTGVDGFIPQLYNYMEDNFCIDTTREYHSGMSNGAMFAYQAGVSMSKRLAAIAPVAGSFHLGFNQAPATKVPVLDIHGSNDKTVPANTTTSADGWKYTITADIVADWVKANGCSKASPGPYKGALGVSSTVATKYGLGCADFGCDVVACSWSGGHQYFGSSADNGALVWSFLSQYANTAHLGHGQLQGEPPARYELLLTNVTSVSQQVPSYTSTGIDIGTATGFTFESNGQHRVHYGNPAQGCLHDEDVVELPNGLVTGTVCAPKRQTRNALPSTRNGNRNGRSGDDDAYDVAGLCTLGGLHNPSNGCPTDLPAPSSKGPTSAFPQCLMDGDTSGGESGLSPAHCFLTCDPCNNNGFDACDDAAHAMCPDNADCVTGVLKNVKMGVCVYNSNARPQKFHIGDESQSTCFETTYIDDGFRKQGYVAGACDPVFSTIESVDTELICDGDSTKNVKQCPDQQIHIYVAKRGKV